jgi:Flp pilus assembly protein TadG
MRGLRRLIKQWTNDESGATAIIVALLMPVIAGMAAICVDILLAYNQQERLRTVAEAAATAAVTVLPDRDAAQGAALSYARRNVKGDSSDKVVSADDIQIGYWNQNTRVFTLADDDERANAIRVTASRTAAKGNPQPSFFGQVLGVSAFNAVVASATAMQPAGFPCINVLAPTGTGLKLNSNGKINLTNCDIHVHSADGSAFSADSNAKVTVSDGEICVQGGAQVKSNSIITPAPDTNCSPMRDQFADVTPPPFTCPERTESPINANQTKTLPPCTYRGGLTLNSNSTLNLQPGEYIIKDGPLIVSSNATLNGTGVAIYLTGNNAQIIFNSNAKINLTAPLSGPLEGFVLFQDRNYGGDHTFNSNALTVLSGAVYLSKGTIKMNSNTQIGSTSMCMMIVAYKIEINSNSGVNITPDYSQCPLAVKAPKSRVVG